MQHRPMGRLKYRCSGNVSIVQFLTRSAASGRALEKEPNRHFLWFASGRSGGSAVSDLYGVSIVTRQGSCLFLSLKCVVPDWRTIVRRITFWVGDGRCHGSRRCSRS